MMATDWLSARLNQVKQLGGELEAAKSNDAELAAQERDLMDALQKIVEKREAIASRSAALNSELEAIFGPPSSITEVPTRHRVSTVIHDQRTDLPESSTARLQRGATNGCGTNASGRNAMPPPRTSFSHRDITYSPDAESDTSGTLDGYPILNDNHCNIVRIDGKVVAISCFVRDCRANCSSHSNRAFFRGVQGLRGHIVQMHPEHRGIDLDEVARRCTKDVLSKEEARMLVQGRLPAARIVPSYNTNDSRNPNRNPDQSTHLNDLPYINSKYRHIILIKGVWTELACDVDGCGANFSKSGNAFFNGFKGMHNHIQQAHGKKGLKAEEALAYCSQRTVSDRDVALMGGSQSLPPEDHVPRKKPYENDSAETLKSTSPEVVPFRRSTRDTDTIPVSTPSASAGNGLKRSADIAGLLERFSTPQTGESGFFRSYGPAQNSHTSSGAGKGKLPANKPSAYKAPTVEDSLEDLRKRRFNGDNGGE